jgi:hypothetical protein
MSKDDITECYINEDEAFRVTSKIKCIVKHFPQKGKNVYGIKKINSDGSSGVIKKGIRIPTWLFVLYRFWYLALSVLLVTTLCLFAAPTSTSMALLATALYYKLAKPFSTHRSVNIMHSIFVILFVVSAIIVLYLSFGNNKFFNTYDSVWFS